MKSRSYYRNDPVYKIWNVVESECHQKVALSHPNLKSYLIDAMPVENFLNSQTHCVAITNSILSDSINNTSIIRVNDSFYGVYYCAYPIYQTIPSKNFNCFINRMDPFRQSWLYQLVRRKIFDQGYVSFNMDISQMPQNRNLTELQAFENQFELYCPIFEHEHQQVKHLVPYKNFIESGDLSAVVLDSKFSIVLETYFNKNHVVTYSEKIFRCLQLPRPWVLFAMQYAVSHLRRMGFDVLDDIVDHSQYDCVELPIDRQCKILDMIENLIQLDVDKYQSRLMSAAYHNQMLLKKFSDTWETDFDNTIKLGLQKLND
jgi:hypothetical protein